MDQSLDEIITAKRRGRGRGNRGGRFRGGRGGQGLSTNNRGRSGAPVRRGRGRGRGGFNTLGNGYSGGKWQHDMFQGAPGGGGIGIRTGTAGGQGAKLLISNLDFGVSDSDIKELFAELGTVIKAMVHYDKSGRSQGTANVIYSRNTDAIKAMNKYNNVPLDGRPMDIQLVSGTTPGGGMGGTPRRGQGQRGRGGFRQQQQQQFTGGAGTGGGLGGGRGNRGRGGRGRGRGRGGRGAKTPVPTADELDAELDAWKGGAEIQSHFDGSKSMSNRSVIDSVAHISTGSVVLSFGQVVLKQFVLPVLAVVTLEAARVILEGSGPHTVGHQQEASQHLKHISVADFNLSVLNHVYDVYQLELLNSTMAGRILCSYCHRQGFKQLRRLAVRSRWLSATAEETVPSPVGSSNYPPKIEQIVNDISQLTLLETSQLNELLKATLNIPDAPMMAMGPMPLASSEDEVSPKKEEQSEFTVRLVKYEESSKIKLIKEIKVLMDGMNLVQSKKFVEGVPQVIKSEVSKEEAERLKVALEAAGGVVELD
ncbi:uncharacterized protein LOC135351429 [Halichondria panicea]|uniref:uncharacterized protein LOC135351429 n=1 Tax=Halichondria panicea TaxID=6063 RepID=UPI00312B4991